MPLTAEMFVCVAGLQTEVQAIVVLATVITLEFIPMLASSEGMLLCSSEARILVFFESQSKAKGFKSQKRVSFFMNNVFSPKRVRECCETRFPLTPDF